MNGTVDVVRPIASWLDRLSLRKAFLLYVGAALATATALSLLTLFVLGAVEQKVYDDSYGGTASYVYDEARGTLVAAQVRDLAAVGDDFAPVYLPEELGAEGVPVNDLRGPRSEPFLLYLDGGVSVEPLSLPPLSAECADARAAVDACYRQGWDAFAMTLMTEPDSQEAQAYRAALGGLPQSGDEARAMFQDAFGTALAAPFDFFPTSMYTERDLACSAVARTIGWGLVALWYALCLLVAANRFYRRRLDKPIALLEDAAARIARQDLTGAVSYGRHDEMGQLAETFEVMRASMEEAQRTLWRTAEERRRLNAAFAHDLRTPLVVLRGRLEMMELPCGEEGVSAGEDAPVADQEGAEDWARTRATLLGQVERLEQYVEVMGGLQKLEDRPVHRQSVAASALVDSLAELGLVLAEREGKAFAFAVDGGTADEEGRRSTLLCIDEAVVREVAENLLANAMRFAERAVTLTVVLPDSLSEGDGQLVLRVEDDGSGFSPDGLARGTEPFVGEGVREGHLGVGLCIARTLCEKHGGWLALANREEPHRGASVVAAFAAGALAA